MSDNYMDRYYRASKKFAAELSDNGSEQKFRRAIMNNGADRERLSTVYFDVTIDENWVKRIETALPHLEAAIREDRQFIKSEGTISPIERVRKVSRSSVEHLARHSEMITHLPSEGDDLVPDKLKVFENESNFAVYENRVLYMVLCYARDFVDYRFVQIEKARKQSHSELSFQKTIKTEEGGVTFEVKYSDGLVGVSEQEAEVTAMLARIETIAGELAVLLSMPLMKECALAPMVTPPITRTNVLRMDTHFREVAELFDYLSSYSGDGYTIERKENDIGPFTAGLEREAAELMLYTSFLNRKYGRGMTEELEQSYQEEERRRREQENRERDRYLQEALAKLQGGSATSQECIDAVAAEIARREECEKELRDAQEEAAKLREQMGHSENSLRQMQTKNEQREAEAIVLKNRIADERRNGRDTASDLMRKNDRLIEELEAERERARILEARVIGMLEQYGVKKPDVDMTEREQFLELEREQEAFDRYLLRNWGIAKKKIRRRILWRKG